jgi:hypothetical protein
MKILSIDVGIKNLAFCLLSKTNEHFTIAKWDVVNLSQKIDLKCQEIDKTGKTCDKPAKFTKNAKCYCLKHSKKQEFQIPTQELKSSFIQKQKVQALHNLADKYKIVYNKSTCKKADLVAMLNEYIYTTCFEQVESTNASKIDLVTIGKNIQLKLDESLGEHMDSIDVVIIENQISPIANRMKTIQGMIAQYFIMKIPNIQIDFVNASNKLKDDVHPTSSKLATVVSSSSKPATVVSSTTGADTKKETTNKYSDRKKQGIQKTNELISNNHNFSEWSTFFSAHSKKDDLADCFLQGLWFIKNKL